MFMGHDEYLYQINFEKIQTVYLKKVFTVRSSLYAYHDKHDYFHFQSAKIKIFMFKKFNKYDLYEIVL